MLNPKISQTNSLECDVRKSVPFAEPRDSLAIVCNSVPPYRVHLHQRITHEIPELKLWTIVTHENSNDRWGYNPPQEIGPVLFGKGEDLSNQATLKYAISEWRKAGRIIEFFISHNVKAVLLHGYNNLTLIRLLLWCWQKRIPCFIAGDGNILIDKPPLLKKLVKHVIVGSSLRLATGILACGRNGEAFFRRYGGKRNKIYWFPYEPNFTEIQKLPTDFILKIQNQYNLHSARQRMVFSGRLIDWKRADMAIDAFSALAEERPNWDLLIIGDGPLRKVLQSRVPLRIEDRIHFTGFIARQEEISALYRCCDVLIHPATQEQWALVVQEATAANLALVVANTVGSAIEFVRDHINGRMFRENNLVSLIECLRDVTDPTHIDAMKANAACVLNEWQKVYDPIKGLKQALVSAHVLGQ